MSLVGNLEDLPISDILQIVNLSRRTGLLRLKVEAGQAWLAFIDGRIAAAGTPVRTGRIDDLVVGHSLMGREQAVAALRAYPVDGSVDPGDFLVSRGVLDEAALRAAQTRDLQAAVAELFNYSSGSFQFELADEKTLIRNARRSGRWIHPGGIAPQQMLLEATRQEDEAMRGLEPEEEAEPVAEEALAVAAVPGPGEGPPLKPVRRRPSLGRPAPRLAPVEGGKPGAVPVLIVDDEALYRSRLATEFERAGHPVATAGGSSEALDICREWQGAGVRPVIILDLLMPDREGHGFLGGVELAHLIRQEGLDARIIGLCCGRHEEYRRESQGAIIEALVSKPDLASTPLGALPAAVQDLAHTLLWQVEHESRGGTADPGDPLAGLEPGGSATGAGRRVTDPIGFLQGLLGELRQPENPSEVWILVLRVASEFLERAVLFVRRRQKLTAFGGFGPTGDEASVEDRVRGLSFEVDRNPLLAAVDSDRKARTGSPESEPGAAQIASALGPLEPNQFAILPLVAGGQTVALLYVDNASGRAPMSDLRSLEIFMVQLGMLMENAALLQQNSFTASRLQG